MKARILLLFAFFILPNFLLAQNPYTHSGQPMSINQKRIKNYSDYNSDVNLIESVNPLNSDGDRKMGIPIINVNL